MRKALIGMILAATMMTPAIAEAQRGHRGGGDRGSWSERNNGGRNARAERAESRSDARPSQPQQPQQQAPRQRPQRQVAQRPRGDNNRGNLNRGGNAGVNRGFRDPPLEIVDALGDGTRRLLLPRDLEKAGDLTHWRHLPAR